MSDFDDLLIGNPKFQDNQRKINENMISDPNLIRKFEKRRNTNTNFRKTINRVNEERPSFIGFTRRDSI